MKLTFHHFISKFRGVRETHARMARGRARAKSLVGTRLRGLKRAESLARTIARAAESDDHSPGVRVSNIALLQMR